MDPLHLVLKRLRLRILLLRWLDLLAWWFLTAACAACAWLVLTRLFPQLGDPHLVALVLGALSFLVATALALYYRPTLLGAALAADTHLGLKERLTSSLELAHDQSPMVAALHEDARNHAASLSVRHAFPFAPPKMARWLLAPLAAYLVAAFFLPEIDLLGYRTRQAEARQTMEARKVHAERLRNVARPLREDTVANAADLKAVAEGIERIADGVERGEISEKQAVARLTDLARELVDQHERLGAQIPTPNSEADAAKLGAAKDIASAINKGEYGEAAEKLNEMKETLASGEMSAEDAKQLANELQKLSSMVGGKESALGEALAQAAASMDMKDASQLAEALEQMQLSMSDVSSVLKQLEATNKACKNCGSCMSEMLGMKLGQCFGKCGGKDAFLFRESASGLGGPGRGRGNRIGDLPDVEGAYEDSMLSGEMTRGKILASVMQRAAPDADAEPAAALQEQAIIMVQQQAEEALTKEEIPPGAREYVRSYFGSLDSGRQPGSSAAANP